MRIGTDIIEIDRIEKANARLQTFAQRILSPAEYDLYESFPAKRQRTFLAGRFSAKEAYGKALGTGIGHWLKFHDISILYDNQGAPYIAEGPVTKGVRVSISHSDDYATATVLVELSDEEIQRQLDKVRKERSHHVSE